MSKSRQERYNLIYGNTARKIGPQPVRKDPKKRVRPEKKPYITRQTRKNQAKALEFDLVFVRTLVIALVVVAGSSFLYLSEQIKISNQREVLMEEKSELNTLKTENEDLDLEIEQSIDFSAIEKAAKKYGMKKPDSDKIIQYKSKNAEYVHQYGKIPKTD